LNFPTKLTSGYRWALFSPRTSWHRSEDNHPGLFGLARLQTGATLEKARTDLDVIAVRWNNNTRNPTRPGVSRVDKLLDNKVGNVRRALWILSGRVSFVLVIACANVANLLLARAAAREKELALRAAWERGRMAHHATIAHESGLLALLGASTGLLFAKGALRVVTALAGESMPRAAEISLDRACFCSSSLVAVVTGILFGLAPAWHASRVNFAGHSKGKPRAEPHPAVRDCGKGLSLPKSR